MKHYSHSGFTLIEFIVGIAVIGVLVSILLLSVSRVLETAQRFSSIGNLRQIHLLHQLWLQDKDYQVDVFRGGSGVVNAWGWQIWLGGYTQDQSVFFAPSRPPRTTGPGQFDGWHTYGMNLSMTGPVDVTLPQGDHYSNFTENVEVGIMRINYNRIEKPADYLLFAETSLISNPDRGFMRFENARAAWNSGGIRLDRDGQALGVFLSGNAGRIDQDRLRQLGFTRVLDGDNKVMDL